MDDATRSDLDVPHGAERTKLPSAAPTFSVRQQALCATYVAMVEYYLRPVAMLPERIGVHELHVPLVVPSTPLHRPSSVNVDHSLSYLPFVPTPLSIPHAALAASIRVRHDRNPCVPCLPGGSDVVRVPWCAPRQRPLCGQSLLLFICGQSLPSCSRRTHRDEGGRVDTHDPTPNSMTLRR